MKKRRILFVCLGNICRSPAAEGILKKKLHDQGLSKDFFIDSAGILDFHEGELPDHRMRTHAAKRDYNLLSHSRPIHYDDFLDFDLIIAMDDRNIEALKNLAPNPDSVKKIYKMTDFSSQLKADHVPDPYYGGADGFEHVLDLLEDACDGLIQSIQKNTV